MGNNPGISIITPCYNDGRYLREAVESVYAQKLKTPFEILVIDDGSKDPFTLGELEKLSQQYPQVRVIHQNNQGVSAARNTGIRNAIYDYVLPLDADNKLGGDYVDRACVAMESDPGIKIAYSKLLYFGDRRGVFNTRTAYDEKKQLSRCHISSEAIFRREDAMEAGLYNTQLHYGEDWDLVVAIMNLSYVKEGVAPKIHFIPEPVFMVRTRNNGLTANQRNTIEEALFEISKRNPQIYQKHYPDLTGGPLIDALMKDRHQILIAEARALAEKCARHPLDSIQDGSLQHAWHEVTHRVWRKVLGHFGVAAAEPRAAAFQIPRDAPVEHHAALD